MKKLMLVPVAAIFVVALSFSLCNQEEVQTPTESALLASLLPVPVEAPTTNYGCPSAFEFHGDECWAFGVDYQNGDKVACFSEPDYDCTEAKNDCKDWLRDGAELPNWNCGVPW